MDVCHPSLAKQQLNKLNLDSIVDFFLKPEEEVSHADYQSG